MRKPAFLAIIAISIVVAAASLGVTLTSYLGLRTYTPKGTAQASSTPSARAVTAAPPERWNNLFAPRDGMALASRLPVVNAKTGSQAPRSSFVLVGTIVSSTPSARRAVLWSNDMKVPKAFREKEEIEPGAVLASVERDKVWIARGKEREKLEMLPVGTRGRPAAAAVPAVPAVVPSAGSAAQSPSFSTDASSLSWTTVPPAAKPAPEVKAHKGPALAVRRRKDVVEEDEEPLTRRERQQRDLGIR